MAAIVALQLVLFAAAAAAFSPLAGALPASSLSKARSAYKIVMDETMMQNAWDGTLEEEGAEDIWLSEVGWADFMDKKAASSYAMNERPSLMGEVEYYTPDVFSNPLQVLGSFVDGIKRGLAAPLDTAFPSIQNDPTGCRSFPKGSGEVASRTIKPKAKDFNPKLRQIDLGGFNDWGAPSEDRKAYTGDNPFGIFGRGLQL